jgi:hypothetical protein
MQLQRDVLATPRDVLVGTPGRLLQVGASFALRVCVLRAPAC